MMTEFNNPDIVIEAMNNIFKTLKLTTPGDLSINVIYEMLDNGVAVGKINRLAELHIDQLQKSITCINEMMIYRHLGGSEFFYRTANNSRMAAVVNKIFLDKNNNLIVEFSLYNARRHAELMVEPLESFKKKIADIE